MSKPTARMSENGGYLEWSALDMGAAIPTEAFPVILDALLEQAGAVKVEVTAHSMGDGTWGMMITPQGGAKVSVGRYRLLPIREEGGE